MHYVHKKARDEPDIATFRTKTFHFFRVIRLNWLATIELRGAWGPWSSILLLVTVASEKYKKETKQTIGVFGEISIGRAPCPLFLVMPMLQVRKTKKVFANFPRGFWRFPTKFQLFKK